MLPHVKNNQANKAQGAARPASNVLPSRPTATRDSRPYGRNGAIQNSLRNDRRSRLVNALSSSNDQKNESNQSQQRVSEMVHNVSTQMFQLQPANVRQYDPAWMTERLDEIMDLVPASSIAKKHGMQQSPTKRNAAPGVGALIKNPRKNRTTKIASPSIKNKWAQTPSTPRRPNNAANTSSKMTVESVQSSPNRRKTNHPENDDEEEENFRKTEENEVKNDTQTDESNLTLNEEMMATTPFAAEVLSLKTGDDVIRFFARHGNECPVRFFYLKRPPNALNGVKIRPYDLSVVMVGQIADSDLEFPPLPFYLENTECFTMSPKGVVHLEPGHPSEFIILSTWIRHATIFNVLTSIPFFKSFRLYKLFHSWHRNALHLKFLKLQRKFGSKLFLAKKSFCVPLLNISKKLNDIRDINLIEFKVPSALSKSLTNIFKYTEYQSIKRTEGKKMIESNIEACHGIMENVIGIVTSTTRNCARELELEASGELMDRQEAESSASSESDDDDDDDNDDDEAEENSKKKTTNKNSSNVKQHKKKKKKKKFSFKQTTSIAKQKEAHQKRIAALKHAQNESELLVNFVRLVDTYEVVLLASRGVETTQAMQAELSRDDRLQGLFETSVRFHAVENEQISPSDNVQRTITFEPTMDNVTQSLNALISNTINTFDDISRLLRVRVQSVARRLRHVITDPMKVSDIILYQSPTYTRTMQKISTLVLSDFQKAKEYAKTFEIVKPIYQFERDWNFEEFKQSATDLSSIKKGIQNTRAMETILTTLRVAYTTGKSVMIFLI